MKLRPNDPCPCGSGRKYKKCHGAAVSTAQLVPGMLPAAAEAASLVEQARRFEEQGQLAAAEGLYHHALQRVPTHIDAWRGMGELAIHAGDWEAAQVFFEKVIEQSPEDATAHFALGNILVRLFAFEQARNAYLRATTLEPALPGAWGNLGNVQKYLGQFSAAIDCYRKDIALEPDLELRARRHSNLLIALHYDESFSHQAMFEAHSEWAKLYACPHYPITAVQCINRSTAHPLKIGYLSGSLNGQIVGHFLLNVLAHHDHSSFQIHAYSATRFEDEVTARLRQHCDAWMDISRLDDDEAAHRIRAEAIDILVDLDGHSPTGRPLLVARKPAPLIVEWLDYFDTTGMEVVDYILTDPHTTPPGSPQRFSETPVRLPETRFCYTAPDYAPAVAATPCQQKGFVTFGSFNRQDKIHPELLRIWAQVLRGAPTTRLVLKNRAFQSSSVQASVGEAFARLGVESTRIELRGPTPHRDMLQEYADIDIALDTFPYNGGLTSCESLWMGVPIIALESERMIGRQTSAMLRVVGLDDWITDSATGYIDLALAKAGNLADLASLRAQIRQRMLNSSLSNAERFTRDLEMAYRTMFIDKCS